MRIPAPPPDINQIMKKIENDDPQRLFKIISAAAGVGTVTSSQYFPWDVFRYKDTGKPEDLTMEEWWLAVKFARLSMRREVPLLGKDGKPFTYALPDIVFRAVEEVSGSASGNITLSEHVTSQATRDRYLVSSLMEEEAITSSQLEGATTTRRVAKDMIRTGRTPKNRDERMILNNYQAMRYVAENKDVDLTPELICDIHRIVTEGTLENPEWSGRFQHPDDEEGRIGVYDHENNLLHAPPAAEDLPERMAALCDFANGSKKDPYIPPVLRAITVHFMLSYNHPFEDGNGRTARVLFYWSMLRQKYWLTEYISISKILKKATGQYPRSFIYTEQDGGDLTYFHIYHLKVIQRAIKELHEYLTRKMLEVRTFQQSLSLYPGQFNHRQLALLESAVNDPSVHYTTKSHSSSHDVTIETARKDLSALEGRGLLKRLKAGKGLAWIPEVDIVEKLRRSGQV